MKLLMKTSIKLVMSIILLSLFFIGSIVAVCMLTDTTEGVVFGGLLSIIIIGLVIAFIFPIIFADYFQYFWNKEKEKEEEENELESKI